MIVISLEGCHGCGKTELVQEFANAGFATMDEAFMDMPSHCASLHPQSLIMELNWVNGWFQRILQIAASGEDAPSVIICDRSPLSAVFYTSNKNGSLLAPVIREQIQELKNLANIEIYTVHVKCEAGVLWERIQHRLELEPERALYKEDSRAWMDEVKHFYDTFPEWDFEVANNGQNMDGLKDVLVDIIRVLREKFPKSKLLRDASGKLQRHLQDNITAPPKRKLVALSESV